MDIVTHYEMDNEGDSDRVSRVTWSTTERQSFLSRLLRKKPNYQECVAVVNSANPDKYNYSSFLWDDEEPIQAPELMSLADCALAANVHLGLIPPTNFDAIPCSNQH